MRKMIVLGCLLVAAVILSVVFMENKENFGATNLKAQQYFCVEFKKANSNDWINLGCKKNIITNAGLNHVELLMGVGLNSPVRWLALGNCSAPTLTSTSLDCEQTDCGLARTAGTYFDLGNGWWEINTTFTYTCSVTRIINTTGNFNASTGGILYAGGTIPTITLTSSGDQIRLRHNFTLVEG